MHPFRAAILALFLATIAGCSWGPTVPDQPQPVHPHRTPEQPGDAVVMRAAQMLGVPYRYGGRTPSGFDCSGLVYYTHAGAGITVPRTAQQQYEQAEPLAISKLEPGDLLFYGKNRRSVSHVVVYTGNGQFIHAPGSGRTVSYESLESPWYREHFVGAGRMWE